MKAILMSIKPQWVGKIINGIKKDEIRKGTAIGKVINKLIEEQGVAPMLIYCTKSKPYLYRGMQLDNSGYHYYIKELEETRKNVNGKVIARFNATAEEITTRQDRFKEFVFYETSLGMEDLLKQSCLDYNELDNYLQGEKGTDIHITNLEIFDKPKEISEFTYWKDYGDCKQTMKLTRAPESYCYIEI